MPGMKNMPCKSKTNTSHKSLGNRAEPKRGKPEEAKETGQCPRCTEQVWTEQGGRASLTFPFKM